jgi:acyl-CoA synthetase (AMP-forming)/AMP-acid ligase II
VAVPIDFRVRTDERAKLAAEFDLVAIIEDRRGSDSAPYASILVDDGWGDLIARHDGLALGTKDRTAPALISLTSGTTGRPLGLVIGHGQLLFRLMSNLQLGQRRPQGRLLNVIPLSSSGARNHALSALFDGATVYAHPPLFSAGELIETVRAKAITTMGVVPTILRSLLDFGADRAGTLFADLDSLYCFGAPLLPEEKRRARSRLSRNFVEGYASSLSGRISVLSGEDIDQRPETVGRVLSQVELHIVNADDEKLPIGEAGMIRIRSPGIASGIYRGTSRATGDQIKDGWAYPGDIGAIDADGFLQLFGRSSDVIIRGGSNVHPSEIEIVLAEHQGVREAAVVGFSQSREGEEIAAFVVPAGDLTESDLIAFCRARLVPDKRPRRFILVPSLPRNANGKVARSELRGRLRALGSGRHSDGVDQENSELPS